MPKSFAEKINNANVMFAALNAHIDQLSQRGMNAKFIESLGEEARKANAQNVVQEKLKADLKSATATLNSTITKIDLAMSEAKKVVKLAIPKEQWLEFGITAKR